MNPQLVNESGLNLPQPTFGGSSVPNTNGAPAVPDPGILAAPQSGVIGNSVLLQGTATPLQSTNRRQSGSEHESDVVDQEWIDRAEDIVERTHADPYLQSKNLSYLKAQYIKARYNKEIKTTED